VTDYNIQRGPWGKPWVTRDFSALDWGPDEHYRPERPLNGFLYDRPSDISGNLDTKENLSPYHQCQAVTGLMLDRALAVQFKALVSEFGIHTWTQAKQEAKSLLKQARMAGGEEYKSGMGSALHRYTVLQDKGQEIHLPEREFEPWLDVYSEAMARYEVLDWEGFGVCDDLENPESPEDIRCAGNWDKLVRDTVTGEVMIADLKTGASDDKWAMKPTIQVAIYSRMQLYDQETGRRWPIHEDLSRSKGLLIHLPFSGGGTPECIIYPLDLERGWELAKQSMEITQARKMRAYKRDAVARAKAPQ
jgi:hypothetical protein